MSTGKLVEENTEDPKVRAVFEDSKAAKQIDQPEQFKIPTRREDDSVEVRGDNDKILFTVRSPFGISQAVLERLEDEWPRAVVLRLHLKGLSSFRASNGKVTVDGAVAIQEGKTKVRLG
jgi:hypothetical protein